MSGNDDLIAEHPILIHRERRYRRYTLVQPTGVDIRSYGCNDPRGFVSQRRREFRQFQVMPMHEHGLRTIQSNCLHAQPDFALGGLPRRYVFDLQDFRPTESVKTNYLSHLIFLSLACLTAHNASVFQLLPLSLRRLKLLSRPFSESPTRPDFVLDIAPILLNICLLALVELVRRAFF